MLVCIYVYVCWCVGVYICMCVHGWMCVVVCVCWDVYVGRCVWVQCKGAVKVVVVGLCGSVAPHIWWTTVCGCRCGCDVRCVSWWAAQVHMIVGGRQAQ